MSRTASLAPALVYGIAGWGLCGATMGVAMAVSSLNNALVIHALAAPMIFVAVSLLYFRRADALTPLRTAIAFLAVVAAMDLFLVALLIERSLAMFGSPLGTWLPFVLIFASTWLTGVVMRKTSQA